MTETEKQLTAALETKPAHLPDAARVARFKAELLAVMGRKGKRLSFDAEMKVWEAAVKLAEEEEARLAAKG